MVNINSFSNISEILVALNGRHEHSDVENKRWCIIGKFVYIDDEESMRNFPYKTFRLNRVGRGYIGMIKE